MGVHISKNGLFVAKKPVLIQHVKALVLVHAVLINSCFLVFLIVSGLLCYLIDLVGLVCKFVLFCFSVF